MMNYYKIRRVEADRLGIDLFAHRVSAEHAVVSDMDLRRALGFDKSPQSMQDELGTQPLTQGQLVALLADPGWTLNR